MPTSLHHNHHQHHSKRSNCTEHIVTELSQISDEINSDGTNLGWFCDMNTTLLSLCQLTVKHHNKASISTLVAVAVMVVVVVVVVTIGTDSTL